MERNKAVSRTGKREAKTQVIPHSVVAKEVANVVVALSSAIERKAPRAAETHLKDLLTMFTAQESMFLIRLIVEPRVQCAKCKAGRSIRDSSGAHCLECAVGMRRTAEVAAQ